MVVYNPPVLPFQKMMSPNVNDDFVGCTHNRHSWIIVSFSVCSGVPAQSTAPGRKRRRKLKIKRIKFNGIL